MIRVSTLIWVLLVVLSGYAMFQVKGEVGRLDNELARTNHQITVDRGQIHALRVEWATLTQPQRLETLSAHILNLSPIRTAVLGSFDQVPLRQEFVPPAPPPPPKPMVAAPSGASSPVLAEAAVRTKP